MSELREHDWVQLNLPLDIHPGEHCSCWCCAYTRWSIRHMEDQARRIVNAFAIDKERRFVHAIPYSRRDPTVVDNGALPSEESSPGNTLPVRS